MYLGPLNDKYGNPCSQFDDVEISPVFEDPEQAMGEIVGYDITLFEGNPNHHISMFVTKDRLIQIRDKITSELEEE